MADPTNEEKARRQRNLLLAAALVGFAILFFVMTVVRLGGNVADRPL